MLKPFYIFLLSWILICAFGRKPNHAGTPPPTILPVCKQELLINEDDHTWYSFTSPGFPRKNYKNNLKCTWKIEGPANLHLFLKVEEMETEINKDFVRIYGSGNDSNLLSTLSGKVVDQEFEILDNEAFVEFKSDANNSGPGFEIKYKAIAPTVVANCSESPQLFNGKDGFFVSPNYPAYSQTDEVVCRWILTVPGKSAMVIMPIDIDRVRATWYDGRTNKSRQIFSDSIFYDRSGLYHDSSSNEVLFEIEPVCKQYRVFFRYFPIYPREYDALNLLTEPRGVITTPYYSGNYPGNTNITWIISAPSTNRISLDPQSINLNGSDKIIVYDGDSIENSVLKTFTGDEYFAPKIESSGPKMMIVFESAKDSSDKGAYLEYRFVADDCNGTVVEMNENEGYALSPLGTSGDGNESEYTTCTYNVRVTDGNVVNYYFEEVLDEGNLALYDGGSTSSPLITNKVSASTASVTSSNELTMKAKFPLVSSKKMIMRYRGAKPSPKCGGKLVKVGDGPSDSIQTSSYPMYYPGNENFCWEIGFSRNASQNARMKLVFHPFDIGEGDELVVYKGDTPSVENQIVSFTNTSSHYQMFPVPGRRATVQLITNGKESGRGFMMHYYNE